MVDKKVSEEVAGTTINDVDSFRAVQGGNPVRLSFSQVKQWINSWLTTGVDVSFLRGYKTGLTLANDPTDAVNDISIDIGACASDDILDYMKLDVGLIKKSDVAWAVGTNQGWLDTGAIGNGIYHVYLIKRIDTQVVDCILSLNATTPLMPTGYTRKRRIGSIIRVGGTILGFRQIGDVFKLLAVIADRNSTTVVTDTLLTLTVPTGVNVTHLGFFDCALTTAGSMIQLIGDGDNLTADTAINRIAAAGEFATGVASQFVTNTAGQIRFTLANSSGTPSIARVWTVGWIDGMGR